MTDFKLTAPEGYGWCARIHEPGQYFEIDAEKLVLWKGITTMGLAKTNQYVTTYRVEFSKDGSTWFHYNKMQPFTANGEPSIQVAQEFDQPILARKLRIVVLTWFGAIAMRLEAYYHEYVHVYIYIYIYIYISYSPKYESVEALNTCGEGLEVQSQAECLLAVKSIGASIGKSVIGSWTAAASHVPPRCSTNKDSTSNLAPHWNTLASGSNNGHYSKVCVAQ